MCVCVCVCVRACACAASTRSNRGFERAREPSRRGTGKWVDAMRRRVDAMGRWVARRHERESERGKGKVANVSTRTVEEGRAKPVRGGHASVAACVRA